MNTEIEDLTQVCEFNVHRTQLVDWDTFGEPRMVPTSNSRNASRAPGPRAHGGGPGANRSKSAGYKIDTNVDRGRLLNFSMEQERERRRADRALHQPRNQDMHKPKVTAPLQNYHLNQLAKPKVLPVEEEPVPSPPAPRPKLKHCTPTITQSTAVAAHRSHTSPLAPPPRNAAAPVRPPPAVAAGPSRTPVPTTPGPSASLPPGVLRQARDLLHAATPPTRSTVSQCSGVTALKAAEQEAREKTLHDHGAAWNALTHPRATIHSTAPPSIAMPTSTDAEESGSRLALTQNSTEPPHRRAASTPASTQAKRERHVHIDPAAALPAEQQSLMENPSQKCPYTFKVESKAAASAIDREALEVERLQKAKADADMTLETIPDPPVKVVTRRNRRDDPRQQWPPAGFTDRSSDGDSGYSPAVVVVRRAKGDAEINGKNIKNRKSSKRRKL